MKVYISGPMTGRAMLNFPAFFAAEALLRGRGYDVANPARNDGGSTPEEAYACAQSNPQPWAHYLRRDLRILLDCEAVVMLRSAKRSRGARLEMYVARALGMDVVPLDSLAGETE